MTWPHSSRSELPRRHTTPGFHHAVRLVARIVAMVTTRLDAQGVERVPMQGAFVGVSNHLSSFDPLVVLAVMPVRPGTAFAAIEHRRDFLVGWALDRLGVIWIDRDNPSRDALRIALNELAHGTAFGIAPEGTRSRSGGLLPGKTGAAYLATRAGAPILPVAIWGTEKVAGNLRRLKRETVHLRVGELIRLSQGRAGTEELEEYTDLIMHRIASMLPPEYRGVYADRVK